MAPSFDPTNIPVDAVYTWCDDSDPEFNRALSHYRASNGVAEGKLPQRFRSHDELRYSLRSLDAHAPWVRKIYLITNGQVPAWLIQGHPRLQLVSHLEIFEEPKCLPTFNSLAIEPNIVRISGLSEYFVYLNDDFFLGNTVGKEDYFTSDGRAKFFVENYLLPPATKSKWRRRNYDLMKQIHCYNHWLLRRKFRLSSEPRDPPHVPQLYQKSILEKMNCEWKSELLVTYRSRFRGPNNIKMAILYPHFATHSPAISQPSSLQTIRNASQTYMFTTMYDNNVADLPAWLEQVKTIRPQFFCLNDAIQDTNSAKEVGTMLQEMLASYFPMHSRFEKNEFKS